MKLFWTPASPFTRKVVVAARELGLWDDIEIAPTAWPLDWGYATVEFTEGLAEANPIARIPTLITDDGIAIGDSTLISQHLNEIAKGISLIPEGRERWRMWSRYAIADGLLEAQILMRAEMLRPDEFRSEGFLDKQRDRIARCFDHIEERANELERPLDLAQITIGIACGYQDWREWLDEFRLGRDRLARWYAVFAERPAMRDTEPKETPAG
jgi:glutathione S-transferase